MFTQCPSCARTYQIARAALGAEGRTVVCPICDTRWFVAVPEVGAPREDISDRPRAVDGRAPPVPAPQRGTSLAPVAAALGCLLLATGLIGGRTPLVRAVPRAAGLYAALGLPVNVRGLALAEVRTAWPEDGAARVAISGRIRNVAASRQNLPRLAFALRDARGAVLASWSEAPPKRVLAAHETAVFAIQTSRLPVGAADVVVRFADANERPLVEASR